MGVSIHTPIQGVTYLVWMSQTENQVSIHTPIQGVTYALRYKRKQQNRFNPHTHTGCDLFFNTLQNSPFCFNPHTHTGCDFAHKNPVCS